MICAICEAPFTPPPGSVARTCSVRCAKRLAWRNMPEQTLKRLRLRIGERREGARASKCEATRSPGKKSGHL